MNEEILSLVTPESAATYAENLTQDDIAMLVGRLASPEDKIRYPAFLLLRARSAVAGDVYPYWELLEQKLSSANSYQRSIGAMLLAANARWDATGRMRDSLPAYLALLGEEKPITVRQCIQAMPQILSAEPSLAGELSTALMRMDLLQIKDTMRKLVLTDLIEVLLAARAIAPDAAIEEYLFSALSGSILDEKSKKQLRTRL
jgi:hypothetical protein